MLFILIILFFSNLIIAAENEVLEEKQLEYLPVQYCSFENFLDNNLANIQTQKNTTIRELIEDIEKYKTKFFMSNSIDRKHDFMQYFHYLKTIKQYEFIFYYKNKYKEILEKLKITEQKLSEYETESGWLIVE